MKRLVRNSRVKDFGIFVRRSALFFLVLAITFSLFEPGISKVLAESNANKTFNPNYQLAPLPSEKPADKRTITADDVGVNQELPRHLPPRQTPQMALPTAMSASTRR